jgi:hypothetical protein
MAETGGDKLEPTPEQEVFKETLDTTDTKGNVEG